MSTGPATFNFEPTAYTSGTAVRFTMTGTGFTSTTWVDLSEQSLSGVTWAPPSGYGTPNVAGTTLAFTSTPTRAASPPPHGGPDEGTTDYGEGGATIEPPLQTLQGSLLVTANDWFFGILPYNFRSLAKAVTYQVH